MEQTARASKNANLEAVRNLISDGTISKKVGDCINDVVNFQSPNFGTDLVNILKDKKSVVSKSLSANDSAEVKTLLLDLLVEQQSKTQLMLANLNKKIDNLESHVRNSDVLQQAVGAINSKISATDDIKK